MLVDFWTYSCINCIRTLPHLRAWYAAYHATASRSSASTRPSSRSSTCSATSEAQLTDLGVTWPVALDNDYKTWTAYSNEYWPAEYLIDKTGPRSRNLLGEGEYGATEASIRSLLAEAGASVPRSDGRGRGCDADRAHHTGVVSGLRAARPLLGHADPAQPRSPLCVPDEHRPRTCSPTPVTWRIGPDRAVAGEKPGSACTSSRTTSTSCSAGSGRVESFVDGKRTRLDPRRRRPAVHRVLGPRLAPTACSSCGSHPASTPTRSPSGRHRAMTTVLVVDDEPIVRDVVVRYLQREGYDTLEAGDGDACARDPRTRAAEPRRPRPDAARHGRTRPVPLDPRPLRSAGDHADRARRGGRQDRRARGGRRRLRLEAVLAAGARRAGEDRAAPRDAAPARTRRDRSRRPHASTPGRARRAGAASCSS